MHITKRSKTIASAATCTLTAAAAIVTTAFLMPSTTAKSYSVDFSEGDYSVWDGVTYTFEWYESPTTDENGVTVYTISQASDLAALAILTNDLSKSEFEYITSNISAEYSEYISLAHDFEGEVINVAADIDLDNKDWFPIAYPWKTANLSSTYEINTPSGDVVNYVALSEVPELETIDPYVGDSNGNPISTRYWEFPESELRFRDLMYTVTTYEGNVTEPLPVGEHDFLNYIHSSGLPLQIKDEESGVVSSQGSISLKYASTQESHEVKGVSARQLDFDETMVSTYGYKDIKGYTETNGFNGTLDFGDHKLKDIKPTTKWTEDTSLRTYTYDPMGKALVGMLGEQGTVKNLKVRGAYNDIASYSAFVAAYNYGTIDNVYVQGFMSQQLINMIYPINRKYSPNHDSTYRMSETAGTVLPVGHCGYVTAVNNGTIHKCVTEGEATQVFRSFGFMACENNGTIRACTNGADVSSTPITTDFYTDEWSWENGGHQVELNPEEYAAWSTDVYINDIMDDPDFYDEATASQQLISFYRFYGVGNGIDMDDYAQVMAAMASTHLTGARHSIGHGTLLHTMTWIVSLGRNSITNAPPSLNYLDSSSNPDENVIWIPQLYDTNIGESIAANHLYGVYAYTAVGGICAVNNGEVSICANEGNITTLGNTSPRTSWTAVDSTKADADTRASYSYIRPTNQYAFLCTQANVVNLAVGICAENNGTVSKCSNAVEIHKRDTTAIENTTYAVNDIDFIPWTQNGFYQNDCIVLGTDDKEMYPGGYRWWITEETAEKFSKYREELKSWNEDLNRYEPVIYEGNLPPFDRNMPYPFVIPCSGNGADYIKLKTGSITYYNTGSISECEAAGIADAGITSRSYATGSDPANISNCNIIGNFSLATIAYNTTDTNITDCTVETTGSAVYSFAKSVDGANVKVEISNLTDKTQFGGFNSVNNADMSNIYLYNSAPGLGLGNNIKNSTITDFFNYQPSTYGIGNLDNCSVSDSSVYGTTDYAIGETIADSEISSVSVYNKVDVSILGDNEYTIYENCGFYNVDPDSSEVNASNNIGKLSSCELSNVKIFSNTEDYIIKSYGNTIDNLLVYCNSDINPDEEYLMEFENTTAKDMLIESNINYVYEDPFNSGTIKDIPGVLKQYTDTNTFEGCVIQTPDGMISYPTDTLFTQTDNTILSDAKMVYDADARESGALAFYMDHGYLSNRTYDYTVATDDIVYTMADYSTYTASEIHLPAYTRKIENDNEKEFYQVRIPLTGHGVGELVGSINGYTTTASAQPFPKTDVYGQTGDDIKLTTTVEKGFTLNGITAAYLDRVEDLESEASKGSPYKRTLFRINGESVQLLAKWDGVYTITVDEDPNNFYTITPSCIGAAQGELVTLDAHSNKSDMDIMGLVYYNVLKDGAGREYTNYNDPVPIDLTTMSFIMPDNPVVIGAKLGSSATDIIGFTLGGTIGRIDGDTITLNLSSSLDLTNVAPDRVLVSDGCTLSPLATDSQDFTQPVIYTVTAPNGASKKYTVIVNAVEDGKIKEFSILGKKAIIDDEALTISIKLSSDISLDGITPYIVYGGTGLVASSDVVANGNTYTVTDSMGITHEYTLNIETTTESTFTGIELSAGESSLAIEVNEDSKVIYVYYDYGTDVSEVHIDGIDWYGSTSSMNEGDILNLTKANTLTIVDDTGIASTYTLSAVEVPFSSCAMWQFSLYGYSATIDGTNVYLTIPAKYDITNIAPDVIGYTGASVSDISAKHDFSNPVTYNVTAYDGSTVDYSVIVTKE